MEEKWIGGEYNWRNNLSMRCRNLKTQGLEQWNEWAMVDCGSYRWNCQNDQNDEFIIFLRDSQEYISNDFFFFFCEIRGGKSLFFWFRTFLYYIFYILYFYIILYFIFYIIYFILYIILFLFSLFSLQIFYFIFFDVLETYFISQISSIILIYHTWWFVFYSYS